MKLEYQLLESDGATGIAPQKMTEEAACYDLYLPVDVCIEPYKIAIIPLLIAFDIPKGYYIEVFPRSSLQTKHGVFSSTSIIDTDYKRGIHAILHNTKDTYYVAKVGERVLQFAVKRKENVDLVEVDSIKDTGRGGLGSTGI